MRNALTLLACILVWCMHLPLSAQVIKEEPFAYSQELFDAAKKGDADAMYKIGLCYYVGKAGNPQLLRSENPLEQDHKKAFEFLSKAAKKGSALAMLNLGNMYTTGIGTPKGVDLKLAIEWLEKSGEAGCPDAYANIGFMYATRYLLLLQNRIIKIKSKDASQAYKICCDKAIEYYQMAYEKGSAVGAYNIAIAYKNGELLRPIDYQAHVAWLRKAANLGFSQAVNDLAVSYITGIGIDRDIRSGLNLLKMAASANDKMALHNLGVYTYNGLGFTMDKETAVLYFLRANQYGYNNLSALNECYAAGLQNAKNFASYNEWFNYMNTTYPLSAKLPELTIPQRQVVYTTPIGSVVNDCGSWTILNEDSVSITENQYDLIKLYPETGRLTAMRFGLSTTLAADGSEEIPLFEQMLNPLEKTTDENKIFSTSLQILQTDNYNTLNYRSAAYFNMAVYYFNLTQRTGASNYDIPQIYLNKVLEEDPEFEEARELLSVIEEEQEAIRKQKRKERRALMWDCIFSITQAVVDVAADITADLAEKERQKREKAEARQAEIRAKNKATRARLSAKQKATKAKFSNSINRRYASRAYSGYVEQIHNMQLYPDRYDQQLKDNAQQHMETLRVKYGIPYHETEDW